MFDDKTLELFIAHYRNAALISNLSVSLLCFLLLRYYVQAETASYVKEVVAREDRHPWAIYLGYGFFLLFLQYLFRVVGLPAELAKSGFIGGNSGIVFSELFGIFINWFLLKTANEIQGKRKLIRNWSKWFAALVIIDVTAVALAVYYQVDTNHSGSPLPTIARFNGDIISFLSILYLGYAAYENSRFYKPRKFLLSLVLSYAGIHFVSPFVPNIVGFFYFENVTSRNLTIDSAGLILLFLAVLLKAGLFIFAFRITNLENQALVSLRGTLRKSVDKRKVFFSSDSILKAIYKIFDARKVKLFIVVPVENEQNSIENKAHLFEYYPDKEKTLSDYEVVEIKDENTVIGRLLAGENNSSEKQNEFFEFDGIKPIKYHGGLIGCLQIEKKEPQKFTYSAERILDILSLDISPLLQFYRLQESVFLLTERLKLNVEKKDVVAQESKPALKSDAELRQEIETNIQQILSPVSLNLNINSMFVSRRLRNPKKKSAAQNGDAKGSSTRNAFKKFECFVDEEDEGFLLNDGLSGAKIDRKKEGYSIGFLGLEFDKDKDSFKNPSLGYYDTYGKSVASIVANCYLNSIGKKLGAIIRNLSLELAERRTYDTWIEAVEKNVKRTGIDEILVFHPIRQKYWKNLEQAQHLFLENAKLPAPKEILSLLAGGAPRVIPGTGKYLVVGRKIPLKNSDSFFVVSIAREELPDKTDFKDLKFNSEWERFFDDLAGIASNSLTRIIQAHEIERNQTDRSVIETAIKTGLLTHQIINNIENLYNSRKLLNDAVNKLPIEPSVKKPLDGWVEDFQKTINDLKNLAKGMRFASVSSEKGGQCFLYDAAEKAIGSHFDTYDDQIQRISVKNETDKTKINLPCFILEMVFNNLIGNAITAIKLRKDFEKDDSDEPQIEIWVAESEDEGYVDCFVADNGAGIKNSHRESIFESDFSTKKDGGGLGLFLVKKTLERNAASIELVSRPDAKDTVFRLQLPKVED